MSEACKIRFRLVKMCYHQPIGYAIISFPSCHQPIKFITKSRKLRELLHNKTLLVIFYFLNSTSCMDRFSILLIVIPNKHFHHLFVLCVCHGNCRNCSALPRSFYCFLNGQDLRETLNCTRETLTADWACSLKHFLPRLKTIFLPSIMKSSMSSSPSCISSLMTLKSISFRFSAICMNVRNLILRRFWSCERPVQQIWDYTVNQRCHSHRMRACRELLL